MIKLLLIFTATSFSFISLMTSTSYVALNNSFTSFNYSLPKSWVITDIEGVSVNPMFDAKLVEKSTISHFKSNLKGILDKATLGFYYFYEDTLEETTNRYSTGVRVSLKANLPFNISFYKASIFTISKVSI